ncbi:PAAR domain-containing protein [Polymorphobacter sp. PAMC 29334]|uniref:PAAR domain-containing protein n=1 Tax=Polymorphobacter sp. PAMC 29334 TaxID=2862331 RepID=UPI001C78752B|nr:PAAR domain-containing protein [Polymorphobacter sp. PAMC 29334]QYE34723.1 PAAR domain-containing protein [Polymorphobacter sp. PAMC 29334]
MSGGVPAARVGDPIAHSNAGTGMLVGALIGLAAGAVLVGATIATGGAALAVVAAVGGAAGLTSFGGLSGMNIGGASMGPPTGNLVKGSLNVKINGRFATMTEQGLATCSDHSGQIPLATGAATVKVNGLPAGRIGEKLGCSALVVAPCSPNVNIGGPSVADPNVVVKPEVPAWAVTGLQVLGIAGAVMALPYAIATVGVAATIGGGIAGYFGGEYGGKAGRALGTAMGMSETGIRSMEAGGQFLGGFAGGVAGVKGMQAGEGAIAGLGARAPAAAAADDAFVSRAPFDQEPPLPAGGKDKLDFSANRPGGVNMDNLSPKDAAAAKAMSQGGWDDGMQKQVLNSGDGFGVKAGQQGDPVYKFSSAGRDEAGAPPSAYYADQEGFDQLKAAHYDEATDSWNGKGVKNDIALPCYNAADAVWRGTLNSDQPLVTSTTNPASETVHQLNPDGSVAKVFTREMTGGGGQVTPASGGVGGLTPYNAGGH